MTNFNLEQGGSLTNFIVAPDARFRATASMFFNLLFTVKKAIAMNVNIQTVHFDADAKLTEYVNRKLAKLGTFHDRIVKVDVFLKLDNVVHAIKDKIAEIRVHIPRHQFFVKCSSKSFEESFDNAFDSLVNQIKRQKDKQVA